jgi:hypothetical protein
VLVEVNCETDFVARGEKFKQLVQDLAMQIAACPEVSVVAIEDVPEAELENERRIEMEKEDIKSKPEAIRCVPSHCVKPKLCSVFIPYLQSSTCVSDWWLPLIVGVGVYLQIPGVYQGGLGVVFTPMMWAMGLTCGGIYLIWSGHHLGWTSTIKNRWAGQQRQSIVGVGHQDQFLRGFPPRAIVGFGVASRPFRKPPALQSKPKSLCHIIKPKPLSTPAWAPCTIWACCLLLLPFSNSFQLSDRGTTTMGCHAYYVALLACSRISGSWVGLELATVSVQLQGMNYSMCPWRVGQYVDKYKVPLGFVSWREINSEAVS